MGEKLLSYFEKAEKLGGAKARMRVAMISKITSLKAKELEDSPENIQAMENAIKEIEKEFT